MNDAEASLGNRLYGFRRQRGWSLEAMGGAAGATKATIQRWENGTAKPSALQAQRLLELGFELLSDEDTNLGSIPMLRQRVAAGGDLSRHLSELRSESHLPFRFADETREIVPSPYVVNGPPNQRDFLHALIALQEKDEVPSELPWQIYRRRLSLVELTDGSTGQLSPNGSLAQLSLLESAEASTQQATSQFLLEAPKPTAYSWSSNYGPHGWHRYVGRFPPHLVRAILNYFAATHSDVVLDPFVGSGTTLVECRLLGIPALGIEISPLSSLIARTKSSFPTDTSVLHNAAIALETFYTSKWKDFVSQHGGRLPGHDDILRREGNSVPQFSNIRRWLTPEALLGVSIVNEFASFQEGYVRDAMLVALSAKLRSIGNVDVDVVRAEYRKEPRKNVDVLKLVRAQLNKMVKSITSSTTSHSGMLGEPGSVRVTEGSILETELPEESVSYVVTSPPYGVESISYLRTHLLSYRCLASHLREDPYSFGDRTIGSEYLPSMIPKVTDFSVSEVSPTYVEFFKGNSSLEGPEKLQTRILMMMKFFEDMFEVAKRLRRWVRRGGQVAFVIGNKKIAEAVIPTDQIIRELFEASGFSCQAVMRQKLKTNNSNSQVPWQERTIQDEYVLLFKKRYSQ